MSVFLGVNGRNDNKMVGKLKKTKNIGKFEYNLAEIGNFEDGRI